MDDRFPCPCCGERTFVEPPGSYEICSVCGWENDGVQYDHPDYGGGANAISLNEAREQWRARIRGGEGSASGGGGG